MMTALATGKVGRPQLLRGKVLVVAGHDVTAPLAHGLNAAGHSVLEATSVDDAQQLVSEDAPDLVFMDATLADQPLPSLGCPIVMLAHDPGASSPRDGTIGALPLSSPVDAFDLVTVMAAELRKLKGDLRRLEHLSEGLHDGSVLVGHSAAMRRLQGALRRAADSDATVLVEGQPGTGKSLAARVIHCKSRRGNRELMMHLAADLSAEGMPSALEAARGSTLLIEDIEHLSAAAQAALVKHLKERSGGAADSRQPRLIATSSAHLPELIARGAFREDLYYRLHVFPIVVPTLRERCEDIGLLANALLEQCARPSGSAPSGFTASALILLETLPWPGNVGQLAAVIQRAHALASGGPIDRAHLLGPATGLAPNDEPRAAVHASAEPGDVTESMIRPFDEEEQRLLGRALRATKGNVRRAAQLLGIGRATLYRKIQQYKLRLN